MKKLILLAVVMALIGMAAAQEKAKEGLKEEVKAEKQSPRLLSAYKLEFVLRELQDNKLINTREYAMIVQEGFGPANVKIGSKIPARNPQGDLSYMDVGTNIQCWDLRAQPPRLGLNCTVEISNFALPEQKLQSGVTSPPVLNQIRMNVPPMLEEGKQVTIGSVDDPNSTKRYEIALTATKVK